MSTRAQTLAEQFEQVNATVISTVEACNDTTWHAATRDERWPVGVAAWHIGDSHTTIMGLASAVAEGQPVPPVTVAMLDAQNADNAARHGSCSRQEVLNLLRQNGTTVADTIRRLPDEQLDRSATIELFGGQSMNVQQLIELVLFGHAQQHLASIQAAV
ncbi:MAG: DinB family protein [Dehalococcoidia bacterium]